MDGNQRKNWVTREDKGTLAEDHTNKIVRGTFRFRNKSARGAPMYKATPSPRSRDKAHPTVVRTLNESKCAFDIPTH